MILDEAIKHAEEVAEKNERRAESVRNRPISSADFYHEEESCSKCAEEHRQLAKWLIELKQLREQTRWIPVSERLPEEHKEVLTCSSGGYIEIQSIEGTYGYWENQRGDWNDMDEVVAWMPLPQSYTKEVRDRNDR